MRCSFILSGKHAKISRPRAEPNPRRPKNALYPLALEYKQSPPIRRITPVRKPRISTVSIDNSEEWARISGLAPYVLIRITQEI